MNTLLFWLFLFYDALFSLPYTWIKVGLGIVTGFFIPNRVVGLMICALGNGLIFAFASSGNFSHLPIDIMAILILSIFVFSGIAWWVVGRIMRRVFEIIRARGLPAK
jgi:hypothetical protein